MSFKNPITLDSHVDLGEVWIPSSATPSAEKCSPYLRGPIPWAWLQNATRLGGNALATGLAVWHLRALNKSLEFKGSLRRLGKCSGLSEKQTRTGLHRLEGAGLVKVFRAAGKSPTITLIKGESLPLTTPNSNSQEAIN